MFEFWIIFKTFPPKLGFIFKISLWVQNIPPKFQMCHHLSIQTWFTTCPTYISRRIVWRSPYTYVFTTCHSLNHLICLSISLNYITNRESSISNIWDHGFPPFVQAKIPCAKVEGPPCVNTRYVEICFKVNHLSKLGMKIFYKVHHLFQLGYKKIGVLKVHKQKVCSHLQSRISSIWHHGFKILCKNKI